MRLRHGIGIGLLAIVACQRVEPPAPVERLDPPALGVAPQELSGLPNVIRVSDKVLSGGGPQDDGFATLKKLGVRTVISVDGARPDVEEARRQGLRYVHLPISYDGVPREQALRIARAVRDLPGLVYIHCHHGKHRSPAAAVAVRRSLDGTCSAATATALLKQAGTSPGYTGLYAAVHEFEALAPAELDAVSADFPEVTPPAGMVQHMVEIEVRWDHLNAIRRAGWKVPPEHPALDPAHEALIFREAYREAARLPETQRTAELLRWLEEAEQDAQALEDALRAKTVDTAAAEKSFQRSAAACKQCHARYRDRSQAR